jgi:hypothetical protein
MPSLFRRRQDRTDERDDPENRLDQRHDLLRALPASARPREMQRFAAIGATDDDNEGPDEDIEFLESLVSEIDTAPAPDPRARPLRTPAPASADVSATSLPRPAPSAPRPASITMRVPTDDDAHLNVFRAVRGEPDRVRTSRELRVTDVDLDDLLEDLATTAAAIRLRKAA